jgi:hypothetical protein
MAYCVVVDNPKGSAELYEQLLQRVVASGDIPPQGAIFQVAGPAEGGWRVITVWESREAHERFRDERLIPAFNELGVSRDDVSWSDFEAHSFMAGDLSAAAPASTGEDIAHAASASG